MLKPCRECEKQVSTTATKCPHCGAEAPALSKREKAGANVAAGLFTGCACGPFILALLVLSVLWYFGLAMAMCGDL